VCAWVRLTREEVMGRRLGIRLRMEPLSPRLEIFVDLKLRDLIRANLWFTYSQPSMKVTMIAGGLSLPLTILLPFVVDLPSWFKFVPLALIVLHGLMPLLVIYTTKQNFESVKEYQKNVQYIFGRQGYEANDGKSSSEMSWDSIQKAIESRHSFNLFLNRNFFIVIPHRCLKSRDDIVSFRTILRGALGEKASMKTD